MRVVVKVGSNTLTTQHGRLDRRYVASLVDQISECVHTSHEVVLVTSGAIAAGLEVLGADTRPGADDIAGLQAAASVGQVALIEAWASEFGRRGLNIGQVLLTRSDTENEVSYAHACATFERLLSLGAVPVVNENDTVAVEEIRYGDNDALAALVAQMIGATLVVVLTDVEGLYDNDPRTIAGARLIERVRGVDDELLARVHVDEMGSGLGSGGDRK
ncbi:MAG: glutamate 5-kinase, partial [Actinomycetes bacterium]|nr:glutamate 5-kinase [Actinomycetes bacterium]